VASVATNRNIWLLGTIIHALRIHTYLYFSWYPTYLQKARVVCMKSMRGLYSSLVLAAAAGARWRAVFAGNRIGYCLPALCGASIGRGDPGRLPRLSWSRPELRFAARDIDVCQRILLAFSAAIGVVDLCD